jgi:hypothetical protein
MNMKRKMTGFLAGSIRALPLVVGPEGGAPAYESFEFSHDTGAMTQAAAGEGIDSGRGLIQRSHDAGVFGVQPTHHTGRKSSLLVPPSRTTASFVNKGTSIPELPEDGMPEDGEGDDGEGGDGDGEGDDGDCEGDGGPHHSLPVPETPGGVALEEPLLLKSLLGVSPALSARTLPPMNYLQQQAAGAPTEVASMGMAPPIAGSLEDLELHLVRLLHAAQATLGQVAGKRGQRRESGGTTTLMQGPPSAVLDMGMVQRSPQKKREAAETTGIGNEGVERGSKDEAERDSKDDVPRDSITVKPLLVAPAKAPRNQQTGYMPYKPSQQRQTKSGRQHSIQKIRERQRSPSESTALNMEEGESMSMGTYILFNMVLFPDSVLRTCWDLLIAGLVIYHTFSVPINLAFTPDKDLNVGREFAISVIFSLDIFLNFITCYRDEGMLITDRRRIAHTYISFWFWVDAVASLPLEFAIRGKQNDAASEGTNRLFQLLRLFKLLRIARLVRVFQGPPPHNTHKLALHPVTKRFRMFVDVRFFFFGEQRI